MSTHLLRSHEDLSSYLDFLKSSHSYFKDSSNYLPSFSQDSHSIIEDLLSQLVLTRQKALKTSKIAKKFYKANQDSIKHIQCLLGNAKELQQELSDLAAKFSSQEKEISSKEKRLDTMEHELQETEKEYRVALNQLQKLRTENKILKESKQPVVLRQNTQVLRQNEELESVAKGLKETIEDLNLALDKKTVENENNERKIREILTFANSEKSAHDRIRANLAELKSSKAELAEKLEEVEAELEVERSRTHSLEQEIIKQKNKFELLAKQHEQEKLFLNGNGGRRNSEFNLEPIIAEGVREEEDEESGSFPAYKKFANRVETLSEWISEEDQYIEHNNSPGHGKSKTMFILSTPTMNYNSFNYKTVTNSSFCVQNCGQVSISPKTPYNLTYLNTDKTSKFETENFPVLRILPSKKLPGLALTQNSIEIRRTYPLIEANSHNILSFPGVSTDPLKAFFILVTLT